MSQVLTPTHTDVTPTDHSEDYEDWFCVSTSPWDCPCGKFVAHHMTAMHLIIVWPTIDDPNLLDMCAIAQKKNRNPRVIQYRSEFGKCASYYEVIANPNIQPHVG